MGNVFNYFIGLLLLCVNIMMNCPKGLNSIKKRMGGTRSQPPRNRDFFIMSLEKSHNNWSYL